MKTVSDLFAPLTGKITAFNDELTSNPEIVNTDPYGQGWMVKIEIENPDEINNLLSYEAYSVLIQS